MKFPTGGKAREPRGMIRCNSEADSIVWMKEDMVRFPQILRGLLSFLWPNYNVNT